MKYCPKCGRELVDEAVICVSCGCAQQRTAEMKSVDSIGIGWGVLGFFIPLVGLILYLVWKDTMPNKAKASGIGAIIGAVVGLVVTLIVAIAMVFISVMIGAAFAY